MMQEVQCVRAEQITNGARQRHRRDEIVRVRTLIHALVNAHVMYQLSKRTLHTYTSAACHEGASV